MKYIILVCEIFFLLIVNFGILPNFTFYGVVPNLFLILVLLLATKRETQDIFWVAVVCGIFMDVHTPAFFGTFPVSFLMVAFLMKIIFSELVVFKLNWKFLTGSLLISMLTFYLVTWLVSYIFLRMSWFALSFNFTVLERKFLPELVYNFVIFWPVAVLHEWFNNFSLKFELKK